MKIPLWEWLPFRSWRIIGTVESADEVPESLPRRTIVMVQSGERPKWLCFDCPCKSGHRVLLNIDPARRPVWSVQGVQGRSLSIKPSVDYVEGHRRCHYNLRAGNIMWAKDTVR